MQKKIIQKNKEFLIKPATSKDYRFCYNLTRKNMEDYFDKYWGGWNPGIFRKDFNKDDYHIIFRGKRRVGFISINNHPDHYYIENFKIRPNYQGRGLGSKVLDLIYKKARKQGKKKLSLRVFKINPAKNLYQKMKFKTVEDQKNCVIMEKRI